MRGRCDPAANAESPGRQPPAAHPREDDTSPTREELSRQSTDFGLGPDRDGSQTAALVGRDLGEFRIERLLAREAWAGCILPASGSPTGSSQSR